MKNNSDINTIIQNIAGQLNNDNKNILILGAGASHDAAKLPLGPELAKIMKDIFKCNEGEANFSKYTNYIKFLNKEYGFIPNDFKTIFFALNKIDKEKLERVTSVYLKEFQLLNNSYQIIADLFHSQKIQHIINFNFDEILDNELSNYSNFYNYITPNKYEISSSELNYPNYIKPHGSINDLESLRFRRQDYYKLEDKVINSLESLFPQDPVNLIIMGFRLKFHDMKTNFQKWLHPDSNIILFDKNEDCLDEAFKKKFNCNINIIDSNISLNQYLNRLSKIMETEATKQNENAIRISTKH